MIISASRRTEIPAFYSTWFMNRIMAGFCEVPNPFNPNQISRISLAREDVAAIVFWTRDPSPIFPHIDKLDALGYRFVFLFTLIDYPHPIEPRAPKIESAIEIFQDLSKRIGASRIVWRYDPILFTNKTDPSYHLEKFRQIAEALSGYTERCKISVVDLYRKILPRLSALSHNDIAVIDTSAIGSEELGSLVHNIAKIAYECGIKLRSCAEDLDLRSFGIDPGKCIDDEHLKDALSVEVSRRKDPSQRKSCRCVASRDIGMYDSCQAGCAYCYATSDFERSEKNFRIHDPEATTLIQQPLFKRSL